MFEKRMKKNSAAMNGNHLAAISASRLPRAMLLNVRS